jgi:hypothetical protein
MYAGDFCEAITICLSLPWSARRARCGGSRKLRVIISRIRLAAKKGFETKVDKEFLQMHSILQRVTYLSRHRYTNCYKTCNELRAKVVLVRIAALYQRSLFHLAMLASSPHIMLEESFRHLANLRLSLALSFLPAAE